MSNTYIAKLSTPLKINNKDVTEIQLREPTVAEIQGISLSELGQMNTTAITKLVPRISTPTLSEDQVNGMLLSQFMSIALGIASFFGDMGDQSPPV